jgi:hypothetical protein
MLCAAGKKVEDYWDAGKKLLSDPKHFLDSLVNFDKENIPDAVIKKIEPFIAMDTFTPEAVAKVSKACTSICMWVRAMHLYHTVSLSVSGTTACWGARPHSKLQQGKGKQAALFHNTPAHGLAAATCSCKNVLRDMHVPVRRLLPSVQPWLLPRSLLTRQWQSWQVLRPAWRLCKKRSPPWRLSTRRRPQKKPRLQHR